MRARTIPNNETKQFHNSSPTNQPKPSKSSKMQIQVKVKIIHASLAVVFVLTLASFASCKPLTTGSTSQTSATRSISSLPAESSSFADSQQETLIALPSESYKSASKRVYSSEPYTLQQHYESAAQGAVEPQNGYEKQQVVYEVRHEPQVQQVIHYVDAKQQQPQQAAGHCQNPSHQHVEASYEPAVSAPQVVEPETRALEYQQNQAGQPEIVYMNPELEGARISEQQGNQKTIAGIERVASELMQSSGMPATILTEVPARDMPQEVLDRLRQDYGVKVVATRERPGANLIINCDDYSNAASPVCQRGSSAPYNTPSDISAYTVTDASVPPSGYALQDQAEATGGESGHEEPQPVAYTSDTSANSQPEPQQGESYATSSGDSATDSGSYLASADQSSGAIESDMSQREPGLEEQASNKSEVRKDKN